MRSISAVTVPRALNSSMRDSEYVNCGTSGSGLRAGQGKASSPEERLAYEISRLQAMVNCDCSTREASAQMASASPKELLSTGLLFNSVRQAERRCGLRTNTPARRAPRHHGAREHMSDHRMSDSKDTRMVMLQTLFKRHRYRQELLVNIRGPR